MHLAMEDVLHLPELCLGHLNKERCCIFLQSIDALGAGDWKHVISLSLQHHGKPHTTCVKGQVEQCQ